MLYLFQLILGKLEIIKRLALNYYELTQLQKSDKIPSIIFRL